MRQERKENEIVGTVSRRYSVYFLAQVTVEVRSQAPILVFLRKCTLIGSEEMIKLK